MKQLIIMIVSFFIFGLSTSQLQVDFYSKTCPKAETVVRSVIEKEVSINPGNAAVLLRLQFHDCFVQGCDASILILHDDSESVAAGNAGVGGFHIIDNAKAEVERICPGIVSCSDIVALAARDAVFMAKGPFYQVLTGRRDGQVSSAKDAADLPDPEDTIQTLKSKFIEQGLSDHDLVLLSAGAHTIGLTACFFVTPRLDTRDPTINSAFFPVLRSKCPQGGDVGAKIPLDWDGEFVFDNHIFKNIKSGRAVIASDSVLYRDRTTKKIIDSYLTTNTTMTPDFASDFARAMVKMGSIRVKTGIEGEIRRVCNAAN